ncbi:hypothetical protein [Mesorhizobium sp. LjNodule214]
MNSLGVVGNAAEKAQCDIDPIQKTAARAAVFFMPANIVLISACIDENAM